MITNMANYKKTGKEDVCNHANEIRVWEMRLLHDRRHKSHIRVCTNCGLFRHYVPNKYRLGKRKGGINVQIETHPYLYMLNLPLWWRTGKIKNLK